MGEKNILVNRGIQPGSGFGTGGGGSLVMPGIAIGPSHFGAGWNAFSMNTDMRSGIGTAVSIMDGVSRGEGHTVSRSMFYLMQGALDESLGTGQGWLSYDNYADLGMDFWSTVSIQIFEKRKEMGSDFEHQRSQQSEAFKADLKAAGVSHDTIDVINKSLKYVQKKRAQWEDILAASVAKLMQHPAKDYLSRTTNDIVQDLRKAGEFDAPAVIDQELAGFADTYVVANNLSVRDRWVAESASLVDSRSLLKSIAQAKSMARLSAQEQARELAVQPLFDVDYLADKEGGLQTAGYVPFDHGVPLANSGVTIGVGVDLGGKTLLSLLNDGVPERLASMLSEYTGLRGQQADVKLKQKPLSITEFEANTLTEIYLEKISASVERRYNNVVGDNQFRAIPLNTRTAIMDMAFQYGDNLPVVIPKTWSKIITRDWKGLIDELNNFGDGYPTRRKSEAKLVQLDVDNGRFK